MGLFTKEPIEIRTVTIDRIGIASVSSSGGQVTAWHVRFEGDPRIHRVYEGRWDGRHLALARAGDRIRASWRKERIVDLVNESL